LNLPFGKATINNRINVLHIIKELPLGGAEMLLLTLSTYIDQSRFNMSVCCLDEEGYIADQIKQEGIKLFCLKEPRFRYSYRKIIKLVKILRSERIDIVHTHLRDANLMGRLIALIFRVPVICKTCHDYQGSNERKQATRYKGYFKLNILLDYLTDMIIYISNYQINSFKKRELARCVIPNAILMKRFHVSTDTRSMKRKELDISSNEILIGSVGRFHKIKGQKYLLYAFQNLRNTKLDTKIHLLFAGKGDEESQLILLADKLRIGQDTMFIGKSESVSELMQAMDIYVHPALSEPFGIAIAEAMYSGLPVVATKIGGIPEVVIDGETGFLVPPRDSKALSEAIITLIENPEMAKRMGEKGLEVAKSKFSGERYARDLENLYASLMNEKVKNNARH